MHAFRSYHMQCRWGGGGGKISQGDACIYYRLMAQGPGARIFGTGVPKYGEITFPMTLKQGCHAKTSCMQHPRH